MKKLTKVYSIKKLQIITILIFIIPVLFFQIAQNYYSLKLFHSEIENYGNATVHLYQNQLETTIDRIQISISNFWAQDYNHAQMRYKQGDLELLDTSYKIGERYKAVIKSEPLLAALFCVSKPNDKIYSIYNNELTLYKEREDMREFVEHTKNNTQSYINENWFVLELGDKKFIIKLLGTENAYTVCILNLNQSVLPQDASYFPKNARILFSTVTGIPITSMEFIEKNKIKLDGEKEGIYFSNSGNKKFVIVQQYSEKSRINIVFLEDYSGLFNKMGGIHLLTIILSYLTALIIPIILFQLKKWYISPLENITKTLYSIRGENLQTRLNTNHNIKELNDLAVSFNEMMDEVKHLKIDAYEKEIQYQYTQLQYLQLQISPHFFLNFLKTIYAIAEGNNVKKLQQSILMISKYIRYIFHNNQEKVSLKTELDHVKNYIEMQEYMTGRKIKYREEIDKEVLNGLVPALCIQTFIENSLKYAWSSDKQLSIEIKVLWLHSEEGDSMDISVSDNGPGISEEMVEKFNKQVTFEYSENNVGINNIRQRLELMYGQKSGFACMNLDEGVMFEMIIPYEQ